MGWTFGCYKSGIVTGVAIRRGIIILSIFVTGGAVIRDSCVCAGQGIKGTMIKGTWPPAGVCCVARGTICGEA